MAINIPRSRTTPWPACQLQEEEELREHWPQVDYQSVQEEAAEQLVYLATSNPASASAARPLAVYVRGRP